MFTSCIVYAEILKPYSRMFYAATEKVLEKEAPAKSFEIFCQSSETIFCHFTGIHSLHSPWTMFFKYLERKQVSC